MPLHLSEDGPDFPDEFVESLLAGEVVFLCGTGTSAPQMPDFPRLVERIYETLNVERTDSEKIAFKDGRFEEVLGSLSRRLADPSAVTRTVSDLLAVPAQPCVDQHRTILRLSRDLDNRVCVVTTNFDTLLERAAAEVLGKEAVGEVSFAGQALPAPGSASFSGIVHIHGRLPDEEIGLLGSQLVLTSADYGDAYMRSGWASRFLFDLARCKVIALVGYSANDAPVRYFLNVIEADRVRFQDLRPVYAFAGYEGEPEEATRSWRTLAVGPMPYRMVSRDTGEADHRPLWRDLGKLAEIAEHPKRSREQRARAILERPVTEASAESRSELHWLFGRHGDLCSIALDSIADPGWFTFFQDENLWSKSDLAWTVAAWIAKDFRSTERVECAREWRERLGKPFIEHISRRLRHATGLDEPWTRLWRLFCLAVPVRGNDLAFYETHKRLESGVVLDSDLRDAVGLLAPKLVLSRGYSGRRVEADRESLRLGDLTWPRMAISDRHGAEELVDVLSQMPDRSGRILELATSELQSALALETELGMMGDDHDFNDSEVPSIEGHIQNQHREGVNFLIRVLVNCLPQAATLERDHTRKLVLEWKRLPGRIGLRLCLHAMRDAKLFDVDEAMSALLSVSDVDFWSLRRELLLLLRERAGSASPEVRGRVEERLRGGGHKYYGRFSIEEGETDWRGHSRDSTVWIRLRMLQAAGVLSDAGSEELSSITERRPYLNREVEERDFFGAYISGVHDIVGDPTPVAKAPAGDRLRIAHDLARSPDRDLQQGWVAFCRSDPQGAFDSLSMGDLTAANGVLWDQFLTGLAYGDEVSKAVREALSVEALEHLSGADAETVRPMISGLCALIFFAPRERVCDLDGWLVKLWQAVVKRAEGPVDLGADLYSRALNSSAGKLVETLLLEIETRKSAGHDLTVAQRGLIRSICSDVDGAGQLGRAVLAGQVAFLVAVDRQHFADAFGPFINAGDTEGAALRAVMLAYGSITPEVTDVFKQAIIKGVENQHQPDPFNAATIAANILRPALADLGSNHAVKWGVTAADVAHALRRAQPEIRGGALEVLARWLRDDERCPEEAWRQVVIPFFEKVWPKEREFRDVSLTPHLIELVVGAGGDFPKALEFMRPYICPYADGYGTLRAIAESEVPERFPHETLDLVWLVSGPKGRVSSYEVSEIIDRLIEAAPDIEIDRRLQWLEERAERYE